MEQVIDVCPQTKEQSGKTVRQNRDPKRWAVSEDERKEWEEQLKQGDRAAEIRHAGMIVDEVLRDLRRA